MLHSRIILPKMLKILLSQVPLLILKIQQLLRQQLLRLRSLMLRLLTPLIHNQTTPMHLTIQVDLRHRYILLVDLQVLMDMALNRVMHLSNMEVSHKGTNMLLGLPSKVRPLLKDNMVIIIHHNRIHSNMVDYIQFFFMLFVCIDKEYSFCIQCESNILFSN